MDVKVLGQQKKALRDELRTRDRRLRVAQGEIHRLKAENEMLCDELSRARGGAPFVTISEAPSGRLDLSPVPVLEEIPDVADAPRLPPDRLPLCNEPPNPES